MTQPHEYKAALQEFIGFDRTFDGHETFQLGEGTIEAIRHALKLAAIVTGEPSEESHNAFLREWSDKEKRGAWTKSMMFTSAYKKLREQQIAEAQREAEGECNTNDVLEQDHDQ